MNIRQLIKSGFLLIDGAMGTMLQSSGLCAGEIPEVYNVTHSELLVQIHKQYVDAGAQIITANTFGANELKLEGSGISVEQAISCAIANAKKAGAPFVALDIGPIGVLMEPMGTLCFQSAYDIFTRQIVAAKKAGADLVIIETFSDLLEAKAAILATKENSDLPIFCTLSYQQDGRTFVGVDAQTGTIALQSFGVDALGVNCSLGPKELLPIVETITKYATVPVVVQPNAGLPKIVQTKNGDSQTVYDISSSEFCEHVAKMLDLGVSIVGGCCGTTPEFTADLKTLLAKRTKIKTNPKIVSAATSGSKTVILDNNLTVIGERINPTGKKKLKQAIQANDMNYIISEAISQQNNFADILDVNVGLPDIDEANFLAKAVCAVQSVSNLPLQIDSSDPEAIEAALRVYNGKPIINSLNGKQEVMHRIFPIIKKYGGLIVCLTLDENGIPPSAQGRFEIAEKILKTALQYGVPKSDLIIDCLVLTASAQQSQVMECIRAISLVKQNLGLKTVLGVSNVSFGLPNRQALNSTFLSCALGAGLDCAILNPLSAEIMQSVHAFRVLNSQDQNAAKYIELFNLQQPALKAQQPNDAITGFQSDQPVYDLKQIILEGRKDLAFKEVEILLKTNAALDIINNFFIPALDIVGNKYESGELFLPQLIISAETVKNGFDAIAHHNEKNSTKTVSKGKILIATVQGDIHDIGKNIVKMLLQNYGFDVLDLGKDVPIGDVVATAKMHDIKFVALSALMTTTVKNMQLTIEALRKEKIECHVQVGGAVLNQEYADFVGADSYAKDARGSVELAQQFFKVNPPN